VQFIFGACCIRLALLIDGNDPAPLILREGIPAAPATIKITTPAMSSIHPSL
jgi:hypothetical protein